MNVRNPASASVFHSAIEYAGRRDQTSESPPHAHQAKTGNAIRTTSSSGGA